MNNSKRIKLDTSINIDDLPTELLLQIISYVSVPDRKSLYAVNCKFRELVSERFQKNTYLYLNNVSILS